MRWYLQLKTMKVPKFRLLLKMGEMFHQNLVMRNFQNASFERYQNFGNNYENKLICTCLLLGKEMPIFELIVVWLWLFSIEFQEIFKNDIAYSGSFLSIEQGYSTFGSHFQREIFGAKVHSYKTSMSFYLIFILQFSSSSLPFYNSRSKIGTCEVYSLLSRVAESIGSNSFDQSHF